MSFYRDVLLPRFYDLAMRDRRLVPYRERIIRAAEGRVLEVGVGSGLNLPFYPDRVREVLALEPNPRLISMAQRSTRSVSVTFVEGSAESIPIDDASIDTIVTTWTLCTIPDAGAALSQMRGVLRPGGRLLFVEHGRAPEERVSRWQDRLTPLWRRISGGCHLNRPIGIMIEGSGFRLDRLEAGYIPGPKIMSFTYEGAARHR